MFRGLHTTRTRTRRNGRSCVWWKPEGNSI